MFKQIVFEIHFVFYRKQMVPLLQRPAVDCCLTLSWPAGHICPTYKEPFQVRWDNSIALFLHAAIYLEVSLFRWTGRNAFSRETAVYKWCCMQCCYAVLTESLFKSAGITVSHFFSTLPSTWKYLCSVEPVRMHFPAKQPCTNDTVCNAA